MPEQPKTIDEYENGAPSGNGRMSANSLTPMSEDFSFEQPVVELDDSDEQQKKSMTRTKQWKEFVAFVKVRKELFRRQTPGGIYYNQMPKDDAGFYSAVGNAMMEEYDILINFIEGNDASTKKTKITED